MSQNKDKYKLFKHILSLVACFLMLLAVTLQRDAKWLGHELKPQADAARLPATVDTMRTLPNGTTVVNTTDLGKDIAGYGGTVPLEIVISNGKVIDVKALKNTETPEFFDKAQVLLTKWNGKTLEAATALQVDAVSGATYSSKAIIGNVRRGLQYAQKNAEKDAWWSTIDLSLKAIVGLIVALMAAVLPLLVKNKRYRIVQQVLNVAVLGFWCGQFISFSSLLGYMSSGMNVLSLLVPTILLVTAFIYPLFGKPHYYCNNICPFGSLQELAGKCVKYNYKMKQKTVKRLDIMRQVLWAVLMLCLWSGVWFDWINYEPFSAFIFNSASWVVIGIAVAFALLSMVVMRPYCRFVCPTGTLFKISESIK